MTKRFLKFSSILNLFLILLLSISPFVIPQKALAAAADNYRWVAHNTGISGSDIAGIAIDPDTPTTIYALTGSKGVYKSTNGGSSWTAKNTGFPSNMAVGLGKPFGNLLTMDPNNPSVLYTNIGGKVYKTTDGAENWSESNTGITVCASVSYQIAGVIVDPQDSNHLFAAHIASSCSGGVYESTDAGANWTRTANSGIGNDEWTIAIDPTNNQRLYSGTIYIGFAYSTDGGHHWTQNKPSGAGDGSTTVAVHPSTTSRILLGNENGLFLSTDYGVTWTSLTSQVSGVVYDIRFAPSNSDIGYLVGTNGLFKTTDGGLNWTSLGHSDISPKGLAVHPTDPNTIYLGTVGSGVYKSTDGGTNITAINTGLPTSVSSRFVRLGSAAFFTEADGQGLFRSTDRGASWQLVYSAQYVFCADIAPSNSDIIYAGTYNPTGIIKSTDGGVTWETVNSNWIYTIKIFPDDVDKVIARQQKKIFKTIDRGQNWTSDTPAAFSSSSSISTLLIDPTDGNRVYALGLGDFYKSTDFGENWTASSTGLECSNCDWVDAGTINPHVPSIIYISTRANKLFKSTNYGDSWTQITSLPSQPFSLLVDTSDSNTIYAGDLNDRWSRSTDGGTSWETLSVTGLPVGADLYHLAQDPADSTRFVVNTVSNGIYFYENYIPVFSTSTIAVADDNGGQVVPGDTLTYTVTVTNSGWADGNSTTLTATIPSGLTYVANSTTRDGSTVSPDPVSGGALSLSIGDLTKDDSIEVTYQVTVDSDVTYNSTISHSGTITSDEDTAGTSTGTASVTIGDETAPSSGTISINSGDSYTTEQTVTLNISATDALSGVSQMVVSENSDFTGAAWETYSTTREYVFSPENGTRAVYIKFRDEAGNESDTYSDSIVFDDTDPALFDLISPDDGTYTNSERPTFKWKAASTPDATAGLSEYKLWVDNGDSGDFTIGDIPPAQNIDLENNKYRVRYEGFDDSNDNNNYISVYTKSSSEWGSLDSQNDGKLKEGKRTWTVTAIDHAGNERSISRTVYVELSHPTPTPIPTPTLQPSLVGKLETEIIEKEKILVETEEEKEKVKEEGYTVKVKVVDENKNPVKGAKVTLSSEPKEAITDERGIAVFEKVPPGEHKIVIAYNGQVGEQKVNLEGEIKEFAFTIQVKPANPFSSFPVIFAMGFLLLLIAILVFLLFRRRA